MAKITEPFPIHVLIVSYPAQGHINPMLRLGKRLVSKGLQVTCSTTRHVKKNIPQANDDITSGETTTPLDVGFEFFDDGLPEDDDRSRRDSDFYVAQLERAGRESLARLIRTLNDEKGRPVSCMVNNPFIPWVCDVAEDLGIPCATLWIQSCALFASYYHYFHKTVPFPTDSEPDIEVQLPRMPVLKHDEIPSFLHPYSPYKVFGTAVLGQIEKLSKSFCLLADTFEELEQDIIDDVSRCINYAKYIINLIHYSLASYKYLFLKKKEDFLILFVCPRFR